jgi:hypothetical protein
LGKLTARKVETAKPGKYGDGDGLQLSIASSGAKKWVLRFLWQGKAREMGLGSFPEVGLAEAREKAIAGRRLARSGIDPIAERKQDSRVPTFGELADEVVIEQSKGFRNEKHRAQWKMTLETYAAPLRPKAGGPEIHGQRPGWRDSRSGVPNPARPDRRADEGRRSGAEGQVLG